MLRADRPSVLQSLGPRPSLGGLGGWDGFSRWLVVVTEALGSFWSRQDLDVLLQRDCELVDSLKDFSRAFSYT